MQQKDLNITQNSFLSDCIHDQEMETLLFYYDEFLRQVQAGKFIEKMRVINIKGHSGCGKNFIVKQLFLNRKINSYIINPGHSNFTDYRQIWQRLFSSVWSINQTDSQTAKKQKIRESFKTLCEIYPRRDELLEQQLVIENLFVDQSHFNPELYNRQRVHFAAYLLLTAIAYWFNQIQQKPFVIYLSNIGNYPEEFTNFIKNAIFFNSIDDVNNAMFIIMTSDFDSKPLQSINSYTEYKEIIINPLSKTQSESFLISAGIDLPKVYQNFINNLEGNLFFYKILLDLYLSGFLYDENIKNRLLESKPPVLELLNLYSGKLGDGYLKLFQLAALIGIVFTNKVLEFLCESTNVELNNAFFKNNLLIEELETDFTDKYYRFRHSVIRNHYLDSIESENRKTGYDLLIAFYSKNEITILNKAEIIAGYMLSAGYNEQAIPYLKRAIDTQFESGNFITAASLSKKLLELLPKNTNEWLDITFQAGLINIKINNYDEAILILESGLDFLRRNTNPLKTWQFLNETAKAYSAKNDLDKTLDIYERISRLVADVGDQDKLGNSLNNIAKIETSLGHYDKAEKVLKHVLKNQKNFKDATIYAQALASLGVVYLRLGNIEIAIDAIKRGLDCLPPDCDSHIKGSFYGYMGGINIYQNKFDVAMDCYKKQLALANQTGDHKIISSSLGNIGITYGYMGDFDKAVQYFKKQLAVCVQEKFLSSILLCYNNIGGIYLSKGILLQAVIYFNKALDLSVRVGLKEYEVSLCTNLAEAHELLNEFEEAKKYYNRMIELDLNSKSDSFLLKHYHLKGLLLFKTGSYAEALQVYKYYFEHAKKIKNEAFCQLALFMINLITSVTEKRTEEQKSALDNLWITFSNIKDEKNKSDLAYQVFSFYKNKESESMRRVSILFSEAAKELLAEMFKKTNFYIYNKRLLEVEEFLQNGI